MGRDSCQGTCYLSIMRATAALATLSASSWGMKHGVNMELSDAAPLVEYEGSSKSIAGSSNETVVVFGILVARAVGGQGGCCLRTMASLTAVSLLGALGGQDTLDIPDRSRWNAAPLAGTRHTSCIGDASAPGGSSKYCADTHSSPLVFARMRLSLCPYCKIIETTPIEPLMRKP